MNKTMTIRQFEIFVSTTKPPFCKPSKFSYHKIIELPHTEIEGFIFVVRLLLGFGNLSRVALPALVRGLHMVYSPRMRAFYRMRAKYQYIALKYGFLGFTSFVLL